MSLKTTSFQTRAGEVLSYRFEPHGWAIVFIDEVTGAIAILSDWGDYSFLWHPRNTGSPSLKHFLCSGDTDYFVDKFTSASGVKPEFDLEDTKKAMRSHIIYDRRRKCIKKELAREAFDQLEDLDEEDESMFMERMPSTLQEVLGEEPWQLFVRHMPPNFRFLREKLFPAIVKDIRQLLDKDKPTPQARDKKE